MKIDSKDAVKIATDYFRQITGNFSVQLFPEEVDFNSHDQFWKVTLSYDDSLVYFSPIQQSEEKKTKVFEVGANDGQVYSMKNKDS